MLKPTSTARLFAAALAVATLGLAGCTSDTEPAATSGTSSGEQPTTRQVTNMTKLGSATLPVRQAFMSEHPSAQVTAVRSRPTADGGLLYEITYIDNGQPRITAYDAGGETVRTGNVQQSQATTRPAGS
jgi:hypothetical protein